MSVSDQETMPAQIAISVQKRLFKKAVSRNLLKRRIREAYRKQKSDIYVFLKEIDMQIVFMLIYTASDILDYNEIEGKIIVMLQRLKDELARSIEGV